MKKLFAKYQDSKDKIDLTDRWTQSMSKEEKFMKCLRNILERNLNNMEEFNAQEEILKNLKPADAEQFFHHQKQQNK